MSVESQVLLVLVAGVLMLALGLLLYFLRRRGTDLERLARFRMQGNFVPPEDDRRVD